MKKILPGILLINTICIMGCYEGDGSCGGGINNSSQDEIT